MKLLLENEHIFLEGFNSRHTHADLGRPCPNCPNSVSSEALYRCVMCFGSPLLCQTCMVCSHQYLPFHMIEQWNGRFFARTDLRSLGLVISAHHDRLPCPNRGPSEKGTCITVVDISGVHEVMFAYCHCIGCLDPWQQLFSLQLWPATLAEPNTIFTFALLDDYHHHSLASRKSAHDYWQVLCRKTSYGFPEAVPVSIFHLFRNILLNSP